MLATKARSLIWPLLPPKADYQGSTNKILKSSNQKPRWLTQLACPIEIKHLIVTQGFPFPFIKVFSYRPHLSPSIQKQSFDSLQDKYSSFLSPASFFG